jgi:PleD family two-component response regulator
MVEGVPIMAEQALRVILAEGGITETELTLRTLCADQGRGLELVFISNPSDLPQAFLQFNPHVAFISLTLFRPDPLQGVSALHRAVPHIPLILFALPADRDSAIRCLQSGAKDYILEGHLDGPTLDRVLHTATQRDVAVSSLSSSRQRDSLTSLPNRYGLLCQLQDSLKKFPFADSCLILSIQVRDRKKLLAAAGKTLLDQMLQRLAQRLLHCVRRSDLVAHVSQGLFVVVVANSGDSCLTALQRRLDSALTYFSQPQSFGVPFRFCIQGSFWRHNSPCSFREVLSSHLGSRRRHVSPVLVSPARLLHSSHSRGE